MNRIEFGKLIVALRKEQHLTQESFSQKTGISRGVIAKLEGGKTGKLGSDIILAIANGLGLTGLERKELFIASSLVGNDKVSENRPFSDYFDEILRTLSGIRLPSFVINPYADLLAVNRAFFSFFQLSENFFKLKNQDSTNFNLVRVFFSRDLKQKITPIDEFEKFANGFIYTYRAISLRYRADRYFCNNFDILIRNNDDFKQAWSRFHTTNLRPMYDNNRFSLTVDKNTKISVVTTSITSVTSYGDLILYSFAPTSDAAEKYIAGLFESKGNEVIRLSPCKVFSQN